MITGSKVYDLARGVCTLLISSLAIGALGGCAGTPAGPETTAPAAADPDQLLASALRAWAVDKNFPQALALAGRATAAAPKRADAAWMHLRLCDEVSGCQTPPLETRLKRLAPDNGVVWLSALKRAQAQKDAKAEGEILAAMGRAEHFHWYWTALVQRLATAAHTTGPPRSDEQANTPLTGALTDAVEWLSSLMLPSFASVTAACSAERVRDAARRSACERIAEVLQRGDSYAAEGLGLGIAERLAAPGSEDARQIEQRIETLAYQNQTAAAVTAGQIEREKFSAELIELMKKLPREQEVSLAILRWAGEPLTP
jgi:hypothetical protein